MAGGVITRVSAYLAAIVESSDDAIVGKTMEGVITSWNPGAERLYGYSADEVIGRSIEILMPPDRPDELSTIMDRLARGERIKSYETVRVRKDGAHIDVSVTASPILDDNGEIIGASAIARDISERKRFAEREEEVSERLEAERERVERVQAITAALAAASTPEEVTEVVCSRGLETLFDCAANVAYRCRPDDLELIHVSRRAADEVSTYKRYPVSADIPSAAAVRRSEPIWLDSPEIIDREYPHLAGFRESAGHAAWASIPLMVQDRAIGTLGLSFFEPHAFTPEDRAMVLTLAQACAQALERAYRHRAQQEAQDNFLAAAAHDLKSPLTTIKGAAQLLERRARRAEHLEREVVVRAVHQIDGTAGRMAALIDDLLDVTRARMGAPLDLGMEATDLVALAERVVETFRQLSTSHRILFESEAPELIGNWDAARLERVITNLVSNAVKYSPRGGRVTVRVWREAGAEDAWAVLEVRDQGIGIPAQDLPHIFERYHRGRNVANSVPGTGIGLAGSLHIVEQHRGTIGVESEEGSGSTFTVRLPLQ